MLARTLNHIGGRGQGVPLVLLHGFPFDSRLWQDLIDPLSDVARVTAPDLLGFGGSPPLTRRRKPSIEAYADAVAVWARARKLSGFALGGHSMGGYVALAFARKYPDMLSSLLLICTRPGPDTDAAREGRYKLAAEVEERGPQAVVDAMLPKLFAPGNEKKSEAIVAIREMMLSQSKQGIIAALHAIAGRPDSTPFLRDIKVPTLILTGAQDAIIPAPEAPAMLSHIPNARHVTIENSGHMPMLENASAFNSAVHDFLTRP